MTSLRVVLGALATSSLLVPLAVAGSAGAASAAPAHHRSPHQSTLRVVSGASSTSERRASYPVRTRTSTLSRATGTTPSGDPSQNITSVKMVQDLKYGSLAADVHLSAAPTAATDSRLRVGFGVLSGTTCTPDSAAYQDVNSYGTGTSGNPSYNGAHVVIKPFAITGGKKSTWTCAYTAIISVDGATTYDAFTGTFVDHTQKPILGFDITGRKLKKSGYTKIPIKIVNSAATIATAKNVKLTWKTTGVSVEGDHGYGSIKPGKASKGFFLVKDTKRGTGKIKFTATSGGYHHSVTVKVTETRS